MQRQDGVRGKVREVLDAAAVRGSRDFVHDIATPLRLCTLSELRGVLPEDRDDIIRWSIWTTSTRRMPISTFSCSSSTMANACSSSR